MELGVARHTGEGTMKHMFRRAVVTGASRGIGRALTLALTARGTEVVAVARSREALDELAA